MKTVTVIMAGGKSSRMGRDKALLPVDGRPPALRPGPPLGGGV